MKKILKGSKKTKLLQVRIEPELWDKLCKAKIQVSEQVRHILWTLVR